MATIIVEPPPELELPTPDSRDYSDLSGVRLGEATKLRFLERFHVDGQFGTVWLGTWGLLSVLTFVAGLFVLIWSQITQMQGDVVSAIRYFANLQIYPPDGLGAAPSLARGGWWQIQMVLWAASVVFWLARSYERSKRFGWRPYLTLSFAAAISLTSAIWVWRPLLLGTWAEAPGLGLNSDLDWAQNASVLWGNFYYNPWHMLAIFFLFGSTMLWGMHGATILATSAEGSHHEDAEIKDMHSGTHKSMLFWRWTMGFNANPKTIHDWLWWFSVGTVLSSVLGIMTTGTVTTDWYVWAVDHGLVHQYGPITRDAINLNASQAPLRVQPGMPRP